MAAITNHSAGFWRGLARAVVLVAIASTLVAIASVLVWALGAPPALADGDPASDVLATQSLFLPQDAGTSAAQEARLVTLLDAARRGGVPLRVAMIASRADLGSVTELWRRPQLYARFLGQELSQTYGGTLLVAMPNGFALYAPRRIATPVRKTVAALQAPGSASALGPATTTAIERIAEASGVALTGASSAPAAAPSSSDALAGSCSRPEPR